jgi:hypothetical protein
MRLYWVVPYIGACSLQYFFRFLQQGIELMLHQRYRYR